VYSYTSVHRAATRAFDPDLPYVIAVVELDEGPLMLTTIEGCEPEEVTVGAAVEVAFRDLTDEITVYPFKLMSRP